ncbi:hypothetical protein Klosneuvirus_4_128 [Klosneuvirus KNV1]|uniref:Uncharacterized protein n=1 Tax=Klosneuvirus KNV1 TaxID=1977640 RepID=A0A1V0SKS8_9VIRU|nr:hypothetical protein Klosneuvirus_4_128 [Klosneuvirus KNV1]
MEYIIPTEIWQIFFDQVDFLSQIRLTMVCKYFHLSLKVTDFHNIDEKYLRLLTNDILKNYPFIIKLNANYNKKITNVNYLTHLKELDVYWLSGIGDEGIKDCDLTILGANRNSKIKNVNHMKHLKELYASGECGISDNGIKECDLVILNAYNNYKIKNVNHMKKLKYLNAGRECGIGDDGIKDCELVNLDAVGNNKITIFKH